MTTGDLDVEDFRICSSCIKEKYLQSEVRTKGIRGVCHYCDDIGPTFTLSELANRVEEAIASHYEITAAQPSDFQYMMMKDAEFEYEWYREGYPIKNIITDIVQISEDIGADVMEVLQRKHWSLDADAMGEEGPFDEDVQYEEKAISSDSLQSEWHAFEDSIKKRNRFFGLHENLESIFGEISTYKTKQGKPVIVEAGPNKEIEFLFRARVFQSSLKIRDALMSPEMELGPPPSHAAIAGRMNARGISVFYGATTPEIAISEVRPPIDSRVAVAKFILLRRVRLLDVEALRSVFIRGSVFDPAYIRGLEHSKFLEQLSYRISKPVMPDDEPFDYLATQVIADYLSGHSKLNLDGIIYPSVWAGVGKKNIVLFNKSSRVKTPDGDSAIEVSLAEMNSDGVEESYRVLEAPVDGTGLKVGYKKQDFISEGIDTRKSVLSLDRSSIVIHQVERVKVATTEFQVNWVKNEEPIIEDF